MSLTSRVDAGIPSGMRFATRLSVRRTIDGEACVTALLRAGFHVHHRAHGLALLKRGTKIVLVPSVDFVTTPMFEAIARSAGLSARELEGHLPHAPKTSGMFTRPHLEASDIAPPSSAGGGRRRRR